MSIDPIIAELVRTGGVPGALAFMALWIVGRKLDRLTDSVNRLSRRNAPCPYARNSAPPE